MDSLSALFRSKDGWTGADGAYSVQLDDDRTLWLFGDTFVGKIRGGRRQATTMIHNSAAWQDLRNTRRPPQFFYGSRSGKAVDLLTPRETGTWYWPCDGALVDGKLFLFCMVVKDNKGNQEPFQFDVIRHDLLKIDNPQSEPTNWRISTIYLPHADRIRYGISCLPGSELLYVYSFYPEAAAGTNRHPIVLSRIRMDSLSALDMRAWEFWCGPSEARAAGAGHWSRSPTDPLIVFPDGAPEMTVKPVPGISGYVACYMEPNFTGRILLRRALKPQGPWSEPACAYRCPERARGIMLYSAKAHPELSRKPGEVIVTYCRNLTGPLSEHVMKPYVYFPQFVNVVLESLAGKSTR